MSKKINFSAKTKFSLISCNNKNNKKIKIDKLFFQTEVFQFQAR